MPPKKRSYKEAFLKFGVTSVNRFDCLNAKKLHQLSY